MPGIFDCLTSRVADFIFCSPRVPRQWFNNLKATFESLNVKTIDPKKEIFNPQYHEAIHVVENEEVETNTIVDVVSIGFVLEDVVIKPAKVVITRKSNKNSESK